MILDINTLHDFDLQITWTTAGHVRPRVYKTPETMPGYFGLAAAIIHQAVLDASTGDLDAVEWLKGDECSFYCEALGFDHNVIKAWVSECWEGCFWYTLPGNHPVVYTSGLVFNRVSMPALMGQPTNKGVR